MTRIVPILLAALLAGMPASAETAAPPDESDRLDQFADRIRSLFSDLAQDLAPILEGLNEKLRNLGEYEAPEVLPNGDIIIRRKPPEPGTPLPEAEAPVDL